MPKQGEYPNHARFLVVGASGRMTAAMLKHCGLECSVIDLFGDADTHAICHDRVVKVERLSNIPEHRDYISRHEWTLFAGGLESHPQIAQKISKQ